MVTSVLISKENTMSDNKVSNNKAEVTEEQSDEPSFSDPENFEDDINDSELLEDVLRTKPNEEGIVDAVIVVDGIPKVGEGRMQKLKDVLGKIFRKVGTVLSEYYPEEVDPEDGAVKTKGYCFIEYETKAAAEDAANILNGYKLDKTHAFIVTSFRNFEKLQNVENLDQWEAPKRRPYKNFGNLRSWLLDPDCIDQFVLHYQNGDKVGIYRNTSNEPEKVTEKSHWSDSFVRWSPFGTYIATVHKQGVALRGGENFEQIMRFMHMNVQYLDFSPCENFIVTYAPPKSKYTDVPDAIKIWAVRTGELKRSFSAAGEAIKRWPHFRWSFNDDYFATLGNNDVLCIYDTKTFTLLDKEKWKIDNIRDFQWSPQQNAIAYWVAEAGERPGRAAIVSVPDKGDLRSMNTIKLAETSIYWQKSGDNACFKVDRYGKKKVENDETKYSNISIQLIIVHMSVKDYPVSTIDLKDSVQAFAWEPVGSKFCMIQGDMKSSIVIYGVKSTQQKQIAVTQLKALDHKGQVNAIAWSPHGQYLVCGGLKNSAGGSLMFIDSTNQSDISYMNVQEHPGVTDIEWDPTGRYVVSSVSTWSSGSSRAMDFGYNVYNFQGRLLVRRPVDNLCAFNWRPRPPSLLTDAKMKEIKKNMKKYAAEFDEKDKRKLDKASQEVSEKRRTLMAEYKAWRDKHKQIHEKEVEQRRELRDETESQEFDEETVEYLINQEETVVE